MSSFLEGRIFARRVSPTALKPGSYIVGKGDAPPGRLPCSRMTHHHITKGPREEPSIFFSFPNPIQGNVFQRSTRGQAPTSDLSPTRPRSHTRESSQRTTCRILAKLSAGLAHELKQSGRRSVRASDAFRSRARLRSGCHAYIYEANCAQSQDRAELRAELEPQAFRTNWNAATAARIITRGCNITMFTKRKLSTLIGGRQSHPGSARAIHSRRGSTMPPALMRFASFSRLNESSARV